MTETRSFLQDFGTYVGRMSQFERNDWWVYFLWVGQIFSLCLVLTVFFGVGVMSGVQYPAYVWNIPLGTFIFSLAIAIDTIGHRTIYAKALEQGEALVHHITIFAGISSVLMLCLAYDYREFWRIPAWVMTVLTMFYSAIDEAMHWFRYFQGNSDRVEMWSHFFIFVGHVIMMAAWLYWFEMGYPGVAETLVALGVR